MESPEGGDEQGEVVVSLTSERCELAGARAVVREVAERHGFAKAIVDLIVLAVEEVLANVIRHGYGGRSGEPIEMRFEPVCDGGRRGLRVVVRDYGRQVDPSSIQPRALDEVRAGGLGVHIIRSVMDDVEYSCPHGGGMLLRMVKYLDSEAGAGEAEAARQSGSGG